VTVQVLGPDLPRWLISGAHPAIVVDDAQLRFSSPRAVPSS
jgi:hypothetical protein